MSVVIVVLVKQVRLVVLVTIVTIVKGTIKFFIMNDDGNKKSHHHYTFDFKAQPRTGGVLVLSALAFHSTTAYCAGGVRVDGGGRDARKGNFVHDSLFLCSCSNAM